MSFSNGFVLLVYLVLFSCEFNQEGTKIEIGMKDLPKVNSMMREQVEIIKRAGKPDSVRVAGWKVSQGVFYLNKIPDSLVSTSHLESWELSANDYKKLKEMSLLLNEFGICAAFDIRYSHTLAFSYMCDLKGFDVKERIIMLKPKPLKDESFRRFYKAVLDENQFMVMGY